MQAPEMEDRVIATIGHLSIMFFPVVLPLLLYVVERDKKARAWEAEHLKQAMVYQFSILLVGIALLVLGTVFSLITLGIGSIILVFGMVIYAFIFLAAILLAMYGAAMAWLGNEFAYPIGED